MRPRLLSSKLLRALAWLAASALLLLTFSLYTHPDFMLKLANQVWLCF